LKSFSKFILLVTQRRSETYRAF